MASTAVYAVQSKPNEQAGAQRPIREDRVVEAAKTVTPGMLCEFTGGDIQPHSSAAATGPIEKIIAVENQYDLDPRVDLNPAIDTAYAAGEVCYYIIAQAGDEVEMLLEAGANVAKDAALESNGAGALQAHTSGTIIAYADEAVNNSGGGSAVRIRVRIVEGQA